MADQIAALQVEGGALCDCASNERIGSRYLRPCLLIEIMPLNLLVVGFSKPLVVQVMLAAHACTESRTIAVCARGTRYLRYSVLCAGYEEIDFSGADDAADGVDG